MRTTKRILALLTSAALCVSLSATIPAQAVEEDEIVHSVFVLGDSISTGYGLDKNDYSYVDYVGEYFNAEVTNAAVNGMTSEGLLTYVTELKADTDSYKQLADADVICVSIGGNDLLGPTKSFLFDQWTDYNVANGTTLTLNEFLKRAMSDEALKVKLQKGLVSALSDALLPAVGYPAVKDVYGNVVKEAYDGHIALVQQKLRAINSDAAIVFQTQYNPIAAPTTEYNGVNYMEQFSELRTLASERLKTLNKAIVSAAAKNDVLIADIADAFANPSDALVETEPTEWIYTNVFKNNTFNMDIHPNALGHAVIGATVLNVLDAQGGTCSQFDRVLASSVSTVGPLGRYRTVAKLLGNYAVTVNAVYTIGKVSAKPGDTVTVPVTIYGDTGTAGIDVQFAFPRGITYTKRVAGTAYTGTPEWNPDSGSYVWADGTGHSQKAVDGSTLTSFKFTVPDNAFNGFYPITFAQDKNDNLLVDVVDGNIVKDENNRPNVGTLNVQCVNGGITVTGGTDRGDVDDNGKVDVTDAIRAMQEYSKGLLGQTGPLTETQRLSADVDANGVIDLTDAIYILKFYAKSMLNSNVSWNDIIKK